MFLHAEADRQGEEARRRSPQSPLPLGLEPVAACLPLPVLRHVADEATRLGVPADIVLLAEGHISAEAYYQALAASLGLAFAARPPRPRLPIDADAAARMGVLPLAPNPDGWRYLFAPRGDTLDEVLALLRTRKAAPSPAIALTTPDRLDALIRRIERRDILRAASHALPDWNDRLSARDGLSPWQTAVCFLAATLLSVSAWLAPALCWTALALAFLVAFTLFAGLRIIATAASPPLSQPGGATRIADRELPVYTIVVPLFREARVVRRLVAALDRLDYPKAKLDVIVMVEANDPRTLEALTALNLPGCYRTVMAPAGRPQTKPRALNLALRMARGDYLVVYDAEDDPEPAQLRDALARFASRPDLACLQARLAIDNAGDGWLTRLFAIEYAALFDVVNPGLAALGLPIPLGGTSNHFRTAVLRRLNGWDAWNVTEDIDLGIRLARFGLRVETLASSTFEEAPNTLKAWLAQRRRWLKGWMVTLGTHSRSPGALFRDLGVVHTLAVAALVFGTVASCLLGPFCGAAVVIRLWTGALLHPQTTVDLAWSLASGLLLMLGVASAVWPAALGLHRRGWRALAPWLALLPVYFTLLSVAAWGAAYEAAGRPYSWSKTEHGRAKRRVRLAA